MAGIVLTSQFYGDDGRQYTIEIFDNDGGSAYNTFSTVKGSNVLTHDGNDNDPYKRIIHSKFTTTLLMHTDEYSVDDKSAILDFYNNLTQSPEGRYYIRVIDESFSVMFFGKILADVGELTLSYHKDLTITATDGMIGLKDIEYRPHDYSDTVPDIHTNKIRISEHIADILQRNDVIQVWKESTFNVTGTLFTAATFWTEENYTGSDNILYATAMRNHYFDRKNDFYKKYMNCYEVLEDILTGFNARMIYNGNWWHIEQLGYLDNLTITRTTFDFDGHILFNIPNQKPTQNITTNQHIKILADPRLKWIAPLKAVSLKQNKAYNNALSGLDIFFHRTDPDNRGPVNLGYQIGIGKELIFDLYFDVELNPSISILPTSTPVYEVEIKMGDYYLKNLNEGFAGYTTIKTYSSTSTEYWELLSCTWTLTPSTLKFRQIIDPNYNLESLKAITYIKFKSIQGLSSAIVEDGELSITLVSWKCIDYITTSEIPADTAKLIKWSINKKSRIIISQNGLDGFTEVPDDTTIYEIGNSRNTIVYDTKLRFYDAPYRLNSLFVIEDTNFGDVPIHTTGWTDPDIGGTYEIQKLVLKQMLGMRALPTRLYRMVLIHTNNGVFYFDYRFAIAGSIYIPLRWVHNLDNSTYEVSLWKIQKDFAGQNVTNFTDRVPDRFVKIIEDQDAEILESERYFPSIAERWTRKFIDVSDNYIDFENDIRLEYYINTSVPEVNEENFDIFNNGVRQRFKDPAGLTFPLTGGELEIDEWTADTEENHMWFGLTDDAVIFVKYLKL